MPTFTDAPRARAVLSARPGRAFSGPTPRRLAPFAFALAATFSCAAAAQDTPAASMTLARGLYSTPTATPAPQGGLYSAPPPSVAAAVTGAPAVGTAVAVEQRESAPGVPAGPGATSGTAAQATGPSGGESTETVSAGPSGASGAVQTGAISMAPAPAATESAGSTVPLVQTAESTPAQSGGQPAIEPSARLPLFPGLLLTVFAALLALFAGLLWWSTRALWKETKTNRAVAEAASRAAADSARTALVGAETASLAERPRWIVASMRMQILGPTEAGGIECRVEATLTNHGRTPAEITGAVFAGGVANELGASPRYPDGGHFADFGEVVRPGESLDLRSLAIPIPPEELEALRAGTTRLWGYGYVAYRDFLDGHWTRGFVGVLDVGRTQWSGAAPEGGSGPLCPPPAGLDAPAWSYMRQI
ncbi:hypothetical protein [Burkholderia sp. WAC0059]|uniref:hypothetical protein n=1 Tax=Burkholderia sp. WAC0059 TaxID=2066022 RepID=UPI0011AF2BE5|nr:hypothetical protein [Burkholderia sp. WAC0059]